MTQNNDDDIRLAAPVETDVSARRGARGIHVPAVESLDVDQVHVLARTAPSDLTGKDLVDWIRTAKGQISGQATKVIQRARDNVPGREFTMEGCTTLMPSSGKVVVFTTITRTA